MPEIHTVFVEVERPRGDFGGRTAEGLYIVENDEVILVDRHGNPAIDTGKKYTAKLAPGEPAKPVAAILTKKLRKALRGPNAGPDGFSRPIVYPKSWKKV